MAIKVVLGDITKLKVDGIVNAANKTLLGGGGVDGAIHKAAGHELLLECRKLGGCRTGGAKITEGYNLPAKFIIHTVGPIFLFHNKYDNQKLLKACYLNSLNLAKEYNLNSLAFSCISTGVYGYPKKAAAKIAIDTTNNWLYKNHSSMDIIFCTFDHENEKIYTQILDK